MPAIDLTTLRKQVQVLTVQFTNPGEFLIQLKLVLEYYQNFTFKKNNRISSVDIPSYHTPRQVLSLIDNELNKSANNDPRSALVLIDQLWLETYLEAKILAINLIGSLPSELAMPRLLKYPEMIHEIQGKDDFFPLITGSLMKVRKDFPHGFKNVLKTWLDSPDMDTKRWGIRVMKSLVEENRSDDVPLVFELIKPELISANESILDGLAGCLTSLFIVSPDETKLYLEDFLNEINDPTKLQIFLKLIRKLPDKHNNELRSLIKSKLAHISRDLPN